MGSPKPRITKKIAGGSPAPDGRYPYIVSLRELFVRDSTDEEDFRYFCGAALIAPDWAITAASCVDGSRDGVEDPAVFGGTIWRKGPFTELSFTSETFIHPQWISDPHPMAGFDVALVKLPCQSNLPTIKLPPKDLDPELADLWAIGWGRTGPNSAFVDRLNEVKLPYTKLKACRDILGTPLHDSLICAGRGSGDLCQGDTGAPLVSKSKSFKNDVLVGISPDLVGDCGFAGKPVIFTSIVAVRDWIDETIADNTDPEPVTGLDIVKALKKGSDKQPQAAELVELAVDQGRNFAISGAVRIAVKRGVVQEISAAIVQALEDGLDEDELQPALELAIKALGP